MRMQQSYAAWQVNRDLAAAEERAAVVAFINREVARLAETDDEHHTGNVLRALAMCIDAGDHRRT